MHKQIALHLIVFISSLHHGGSNKESDLKYNLETMKKNATYIYIYIYVVTFDKLQSNINKYIEAGMAMELSFVNKVTLGANELISMLDISELSVFIKYINLITNILNFH